MWCITRGFVNCLAQRQFALCFLETFHQVDDPGHRGQRYSRVGLPISLPPVDTGDAWMGAGGSSGKSKGFRFERPSRPAGFATLAGSPWSPIVFPSPAGMFRGPGPTGLGSTTPDTPHLTHSSCKVVLGILRAVCEIGDLACTHLDVHYPEPPEPSDRVGLERGTTGISGRGQERTAGPARATEPPKLYATA